MSNKSNRIRAERRFFHDIASSIGAALFMSDALMESLRAKKASLEEIEAIVKALNKTKALLDSRRIEVIKLHRAEADEAEDADETDDTGKESA
jgi:hypothetical protein